MEIFENFINLCDIKKDWKVEEQKDRLIDEIKTLVGEESVVMGVSGGVDSLVGSFLIERAIGKRVFCVYVDTGLMRKDETQFVKEMYDELGFDNFEVVDASSLFLGKLKGVTDPEKKRKIIGNLFIKFILFIIKTI